MKKVKSFTLSPLDTYLEERSKYLNSFIEEQTDVIWEDFLDAMPELQELFEKYSDTEEGRLLIDAGHKGTAFILSRLAALMLLNNYETQRLVLQSMETEGEEQ